jgi:hypothetical protein
VVVRAGSVDVVSEELVAVVASLLVSLNCISAVFVHQSSQR